VAFLREFDELSQQTPSRGYLEGTVSSTTPVARATVTPL
jgi:hypothetical protein